MGWGCSGIGTSLMANGLAATPVALGGSEEVKKEYLGDAHRGAEAGLLLPDRAGRRLRRLRDEDHAPSRRATSTSSTAPSASSPTAATPTGSRSTPRPTRTPAIAASRAFVVADGRTRSRSTRRRTRWVSGPPTPRPSPSTKPRSPPRTCSARRTKGFKLAMMTLDRTASGRRRRWPSASAAPRSSTPRTTRRSASSSASRSRCTRRSQFMIADMATKVEAGRLLVWQLGRPARPGQAQHASSPRTAKRFAADSAMEITADAVQVYGGYGFIKEYPVEKLMRDAKIMQLYEGTSPDPAPGDRQGAPHGPPGRRGDARGEGPPREGGARVLREPAGAGPSGRLDPRCASAQPVRWRSRRTITSAPETRGARRSGAGRISRCRKGERLSDRLDGWFSGPGPKTVGSLIELFGEKSFAVLVRPACWRFRASPSRPAASPTSSS